MRTRYGFVMIDVWTLFLELNFSSLDLTAKSRSAASKHTKPKQTFFW